jgi:hypothetical protein
MCHARYDEEARRRRMKEAEGDLPKEEPRREEKIEQPTAKIKEKVEKAAERVMAGVGGR